MATTALGIAPDSTGAGVDPLTHRKIIQGRWQSTGVVSGLAVSQRADLAYDVAPGVAVLSRSEADGFVEAYWPGGRVQTKAGDPSSPRVDAVYLVARDASQGDADSRVAAGVAQGQPSASPAPPALPAGALAVAWLRVEAGATATQGAASVQQADYAIPYGASMGLLGEYWDKRSYVGNPDPIDFFGMACRVSVPTDRLVRVSVAVNYSSSDVTKPSEETYAVQVDGADVPYQAARFSSQQSWETHTFEAIVELARGDHQVRLRNRHTYGPAASYHYGGDGAEFVGRRLTVWDAGVAR